MLWKAGGEPWFSSARKVLFIFLLVSFLWIIVSDRLVAAYITDPRMNLAAQTYKGWFYVLVVGMYIFLIKDLSNKRISVSEKRYEGIIKNTNAAYFRMDKNAKVVEVNSAFLKMYKYSFPEEVIGKGIEFFNPPEYLRKTDDLVKRLLSGEMVSGEAERLNADGSIGYMSYSASPVYKDGEIVGLEAFMVDVTEQKRVEELLKEREKKFHSLFENMVEGVAIHELIRDRKGKAVNYRILDVNDSFSKNTGLSITKVKDKLATEAYQVDEAPYLADYASLGRDKESITFEVSFEPLERQFHISAFSLDKDHFVTVFQDITERKKFESEIINLTNRTLAEKKKFEMVVREMADAVVVIDRTKTITMTNSALEELSGFSEEELMGKKYEDVLKFVYEKSGEIIEDIPAPIFNKGITKRPKEDVCLVRKDGSLVAVDGVASPVKDEFGEVVGAVGLMRDVTRQRELDRLKTDFVSMASHQLRTPLTGVKWFIELLKEQGDKLGKEESQKFLTNIAESNERMIALVNDLLNVSKIDSGAAMSRPAKAISLKEILSLAVKDQGKMIRDMEASIEGVDKIDDNINLRGDMTHYLQIFGNLINNAVKYSKKGATVKISVETKDGLVEVVIEDHGVGIPSEEKKRIFEKFFRADNVSKHLPGSGLGLYVVKSLIDNYEGKIRIESKEGVGTKVYVQLPFIINNNG